MNKKTSFFQELIGGKWFPLLLIFIMAVTYGPQLPELGFYLDDWVSIAAYDQGGENGLIAFGINDSRPFTAWMMAKFFAVLGSGVLQWQLITLFWRFAAALTCFFLLKSIWPEKKSLIGFISLFFGAFPYFRHQPICIAYFSILMQYFVIMLSFLCTVKALQCGNKALKILLILISWAASIFHLLSVEYYLSLEAARLLLIFFVLQKRDGKSFRETALRSLLVFLPFILILCAILGYRFIYIPSLSQDVRPISIFSKHKGINAILHVGGLVLQYLTESILGVWYRSIKPSELDLTIHNAQLGLGLGFLAGCLVFLCLMKTRSEVRDESRKEEFEMLILGAFAMFLGFLPGMVINASPAGTSNYSDRYLIPSFWGIAIFTAAWMKIIFQNHLLRNILYAVIICIAVFFQIQNAFMYRYSWKYQQQFQWQLKWRIPDLQENTALISDGVVASFMGDWADGSMVFEMYGKKKGLVPTSYWYFDASAGNAAILSALGTDKPLYLKSKMYEFSTDSENALLITKPEYGKCVWVIDEADDKNPYLESQMLPYLGFQNKSRIITDSDYRMSEEIFGSDYVHDWCYYFEKADLAFDMGSYEESLALYDEAMSNGIKVGNATEMRPFIKAAAFSGDWEKALEYTEAANSKNPKQTGAYFEKLWQIIERDAPDSDGKTDAVEKAKEIWAD